jgi:hypothetical protein
MRANSSDGGGGIDIGGPCNDALLTSISPSPNHLELNSNSLSNLPLLPFIHHSILLQNIIIYPNHLCYFLHIFSLIRHPCINILMHYY